MTRPDPLEEAALGRFLHVANKRTYANKDMPQAEASRLRSQDYEFEQGHLTYHDTFFGDRDFIGEEIVYKNRKPVWGANYFGFIMADEAGENELYDFLRKALMQEHHEPTPVRGPARFSEGRWSYQFAAKGDVANFTWDEETSLGRSAVYRLHIQGAFIR